MKTLSYYQNLRDDYADIIPKTAPAYELIEALDVLIASLQPQPETQPHFLGVPVNLPKGWSIVSHHDNHQITLMDSRGVRRAYVYRNIEGTHVIWWDGKYKTAVKTQKEAIEWLNDKANKL